MTRLARAWGAMDAEQRLAGLAAAALLVTMLLPWYSKTDTIVVHGAAKATQTSLDAFQAFSFVEAAVLLVSAGVLALLFARAEQRPFSMPGGDGLIVSIAGGWTSLLIFYRLLDKPGLQASERVTATVGVEWGIFVALLVALAMVYAGSRMRARELPGPPLRRPRERERASDAARAGVRERGAAEQAAPAAAAPEAWRPPYPPAPAGPLPAARRRAPRAGEQLSFEDPPPRG